jgi:DNA-binding transcriptional LysR family regulator
MLNPIWVRSFLALIDSRSFQVAAERLKLGQPTVSQHIQKLEEALGVLLIHRIRSGCVPTEAAMALLPYAESLLCLNERAIAAVKGGRLRVGASSNIGIYLLPTHVRSFLDGRDPSGFELVIDRNPAIADRLQDGEIDVAVMEWWSRRAGFTARLWKSEPVVLIVPALHPLASRPQVTKNDLSGLELLGGEPGTGTGRLLSAYFGNDQAIPPVSMKLGSTEAVKQAVAAGLGVSLVLASAVADEVRSGSLCALPFVDPPLQKDLFIVWRESGVRHLPAPAFVHHLCASPDPSRLSA